MLLRRAEFENVGGDFEVSWAGSNVCLEACFVQKGQPHLSRAANPLLTLHLFPPSFQGADSIKIVCPLHLGAFQKLTLLFRTKPQTH